MKQGHSPGWPQVLTAAVPLSQTWHPFACLRVSAPLCVPPPLPRAFLAPFLPCEQRGRAQPAVGVTCFAVGAVSSPLAHLAGRAVEALEAPALSAALAAVLALPVPRAPPPRLPGAHRALVPEEPGAAHGPLQKQTEQAAGSHPGHTHRSQLHCGSCSVPLSVGQPEFLTTHKRSSRME